ncbi:MAG: zinc ribbon domain-containing protein [Deltaproteobacteria bacterium]|nr:zinc ribbon domain-containing protein [Deltaproteobacteria bacterium]MBW1876615.1 zinc ribbon domain-containing protein [Deltaproteobacteria bacterium]MBW2212221.1 zinc ribbon domain-containing protein [Deltaproteobacteria bacterium]MBW2215250.1 zinc ribbon domain-containing protein [Deltaproteobacteria bacterium]MBW2551919.1 zinc ribbon domain-containing protein [Deltaproteobacteria bacterium]
MPTYDYRCDNCGHEFERQQRITENPLKKCPKCSKDKARRMIGGGGFILKGGGWESDLYSGPSNRSESPAKKSDDSSSSDSSTTKSDNSTTKSDSTSKSDS